MPTVAAIVLYLHSYLQSLDLSRKYSTEEIIKGKMPMRREEPTVGVKTGGSRVGGPELCV